MVSTINEKGGFSNEKQARQLARLPYRQLPGQRVVTFSI